MAPRVNSLIHKMRYQMNRTPKEKSARLDFLLFWSEKKARHRSYEHAKATRAKFNRMSRPKKGKVGNCWVCQEEKTLFRHHVIQVQHGGSNWDLNIVKICGRCHAEIHPWLEVPDDPIVKQVKQWDDTVPF